MTPAEVLAAAADRQEKLAGEATAGPWRDIQMGSEGSLVLAGGNTVNTSRRIGRTGEFADAAYIAAMNPLVGKALAAVLRREASALQRAQQFPGFDGVTLMLPQDELLVIARLIVGGES